MVTHCNSRPTRAVCIRCRFVCHRLYLPWYMQAWNIVSSRQATKDTRGGGGGVPRLQEAQLWASCKWSPPSQLVEKKEKEADESCSSFPTSTPSHLLSWPIPLPSLYLSCHTLVRPGARGQASLLSLWVISLFLCLAGHGGEEKGAPH